MNLTMKEANRFKVVSEVLEGHLKAKEAAKLLRITERHLYRIKQRIKQNGPEGVVHRGRGKGKLRWLTQRIRDKINHLYQTRYKGFNITHLTEFLNRDEKIKVCRESVRQILLDSGAYSRWRRHPKHRSWREPSSREGQMLQFDISEHNWLEERGPKLYLIGGIDDATSKCPGARFALLDTSLEHMRVLKQIVESKGIPLSVYVDKDSSFKVNRPLTVEEQLTDERPLTQIARALEELGVEILYANSPQAKGRIERAWGTFQDRLCSELRLHKVSTLEAANHYLMEEFIPRYNRQFAHPPKEQGPAYRPLPKGLNLNSIFCFKEQRTVASDNTIRYKARLFQILPHGDRGSFVKAKVLVYEHLNGSIQLFYQGRKLKTREIQKRQRQLQRDQRLNKPDILELQKT